MISSALGRAFAVVVMVMGLALIAVSPFVRRAEKAFAEHAQLVDAIVTDVWAKEVDGDDQWHAALSYRFPGSDVPLTGIEVETGSRHSVGTVMTVLVDPGRVTQPRDPELQRSPTASFYGLLATGTVVGLLGAAMLWLPGRGRSRRIATAEP